MKTRTIKSLKVITILILLVGLLTGCTSNTGGVEATPDTIGGLVVIKYRHKVARFLYEWIVYDSQTNVMYIIIDDGKNASSSISPLYNADGTLRIYNPAE